MTLGLTDIHRCLHGIIPSAIGTADEHGMPNVTYVSHVEAVDGRHVALSCQFFNKTRQNVEKNPYASLYVSDPLDFSAYRLALGCCCCVGALKRSAQPSPCARCDVGVSSC